METVMNWFRKSIKNIIENRWVKMIILAVLILFSLIIVLVFNLTSLNLYFSDYSKLQISNWIVNGVIIAYTFLGLVAPLFCIIYKSRMMTIVWIIASVVSYKLITQIPDIHKIEIYDYCADVNCDPVECIKTNCW